MESYNDRLEKAKKMLQPARKLSTLAMDKGKLMGKAPSDSYLKVGRRISVIEAPSAAKLLAFADSDDDDDEVNEVAKSMPVKIPLERKEIKRRSTKLKTPPPFDINQMRKEFCPELRKELESLMMDDPNVMLAMPLSRETTRGSRRDFDGHGLGHADQVVDANRPEDSVAQLENQSEKHGEAKLKLPPVQVDKSLVSRIPKTHKPPAAAKPLLSTVTES